MMLKRIDEQEESQAALDSIDLTAPSNWVDEVLAQDLVAYIGEYYKTVTALRAANQVGDVQRKESLAKQEAFLKMNIALIQYKYPGAKAISARLMDEQGRRFAMVGAK